MKDNASKLSFSAAMQELEGILRRVEGEEIDIDELAEELKRATELIEVCRAKIRRAEVEVSQIVQNLEEPEAPTREPEPQAEAEAASEADSPPRTVAPSLFEHDG